MEAKELGKQIQDARKAKGWTQSELSEKMFVSRSTIANWEQGRRVPDMKMLNALTKILDFQVSGISLSELEQIQAESDDASFDSDMSSDRTEAAEDAYESPDSENSDTEAAAASASEKISNVAENETSEKARRSRNTATKKTGFFSRMTGKSKIISGVAALLTAALLIWLVIFPATQSKAKGQPYTSVDGETYTIAKMAEPTENIPEKAYLVINPSVEINHGDTTDYYIFDFKYHETNGVALTINRLELVYFAKTKDNVVFMVSADDIQAQYGMSVDIPAYGDWEYVNGLPVQNTVYGVGELLRCTDENGEALTFTSYIAFPEV